jgi:hypothetical protein
MVIDHFGHDSTSEHFLKREETAFEIVKIGTKTYIRYRNADMCEITCIDETNADDVKVAWTYGAWADKENLTYDHPLSETINIER